MEGGARRKVVVKSLDAQRLEYALPLAASVGQLRQELQRDCGIPLEQVRLLLRGDVLRDEQRVAELFPADGQEVQLVARLRPEERAPDLTGVIASVAQTLTSVRNPAVWPNISVVPPSRPVQAAVRPNQLIAVDAGSFTCTLSALDAGEPTRHTFSSGGLQQLAALTRQPGEPGPDVPRRPDQNSSAGIIAEFMNSLHAAMYDFLPQLSRAQALLANEALLRTPEDRLQATMRVRAVARYLSTLATVSAPLLALEQFDFGPQPGTYGLRRQPAPRGRSPSPRPAPPAPPAPGNAAGTSAPSAPGPSPSASSSAPSAPGNSAADLDHEDRQREEQQRARDRREMTRLIGVLQNGVNIATNMGQLIDTVSEDPERDTDVLSLVTRRLTLFEMMNVMADLSPLDAHHAAISADFRAVIVRCENNREKLRAALFDTLMLPLRRAIRENRELIAADFDFRGCIDAVNDAFVDQFREVVLREYGEGAPAPFSAAFALTLKLYVGRLAFELSLAATTPDSVEVLCRETLAGYAAELAAGLDIGPMADMLWEKVEQGLRINRSLHAGRAEEARALAAMRAAREADAQLPPQPAFSAAYLQGRP